MTRALTLEAAAMLTEIIDHFANTEERPEDWAHDDTGRSFCLDYRSKDGAKFWLDLDKDGTITVLWKPAGADAPVIMKFLAADNDP